MMAAAIAALSAAAVVSENRRVVLRGAAATLSTQARWFPAVAADREEGGVQWQVDLPDSFDVSRRLASIVRVRAETMLAAEEPASGFNAKLVLVPFGQQAAGSLNADEQLAIASYFLGGEKAPPSEIAALLSASGARSPNVLGLQLVDGSTKAYSDSKLHDYVQERSAATRSGTDSPDPYPLASRVGF
jgi:hypothetical protein